MKKILTAILFTFLLVGCSSQSSISFEDQLDEMIIIAENRMVPLTNHSHGYYSYYIQPKIGRIDSKSTSNVFLLDGNQFVMNLNVSGIINEKYYSYITDDTILRDESYLKVYRNGTYLDVDDTSHEYELMIYEKSNRYFTILLSDEVEFYSVGNEIESLHVAGEMLYIARTVKVDREEVVSLFSNRQTISYTRKNLELFQNIVPENGAIQELFQNDKNYIGDDFSGDNYEEEIEVGERGDTLEGLNASDELEETDDEEIDEEESDE